MTTCKTAWHIVRANLPLLLSYLLGLCFISGMTGMGVASLSDTTSITEYTPPSASVAIIDRDDASGHLTGTAIHSYLEESSTIVQVDDTTDAIQDALTSGYANLIVIIPQGFTDSLVPSSHGDKGNTQTDPKIQFASNDDVSAPSAATTLLETQIGGFLGSVRTALDSGLCKTPSEAFDAVSDAARENDMRSITVQKGSEDGDPSDASATSTSALVFLGTMASMLYSLILTIALGVSIVIAAFQKPATMRRLRASAAPSRRIALGVLAVCCGIGVVAWLCCFLIALAFSAGAGGGLSTISPRSLALSAISTLAFSLMTVCFGFFLGQFSMSSSAVNGIINTVGLASTFLSGAWLPQWIMPANVAAIAKLLPGWWFVAALYDAFGGQGVAENAPRISAWMSSTGLIVLFAAMFVCLGLAVNHLHRNRV